MLLPLNDADWEISLASFAHLVCDIDAKRNSVPYKPEVQKETL